MTPAAIGQKANVVRAAAPQAVEAPAAPAVSQEMQPPTQKRFRELLAEVVGKGEVKYGEYPAFDELLSYVHDSNVFGVRWGKSANIVLTGDVSFGDAPTNMTVTGSGTRYKVETSRVFSLGGTFPFVTRQSLDVELTRDSARITAGPTTRRPANLGSALAAPFVPIMGAFGAVLGVIEWTKDAARASSEDKKP